MTYKEYLRATVTRALDWLEANPRLHITGTMAKDDVYGSAIDANHPAAICWCAMGRILHEMKRPNYFADEALSPLGIPHAAVMALNDLTNGSHLARLEAIRGLFEYAEGIPGLAKMSADEQNTALNEYMNNAMNHILEVERQERMGLGLQKPLAS